MEIGPLTISLKKETALHISREFFSFASEKEDTSEKFGKVPGGLKVPPLCGTVLACKPDDTLGIQVSLILDV